jgi:hypothetical protein
MPSPRQLDFFADPEKAARRLSRWIWRNKADFVVIDGLIFVHTGDENSNRDMGIVLQALLDVATKMGVCILVVHHAGKPNEFASGANRARGASVLRDIPEDVLLVEAEQKDGKGPRRLSFAACRNGEAPADVRFEIEGLPGRRFHVKKLDPEDKGAAADARKDKKARARQDAMLKVMTKLEKALPNARVPRSKPGFSKSVLGGLANVDRRKESLGDAIDALVNQKVLEPVLSEDDGYTYYLFHRIPPV